MLIAQSKGLIEKSRLDENAAMGPSVAPDCGTQNRTAVVRGPCRCAFVRFLSAPLKLHGFSEARHDKPA
jgi:hypothetical protein